MSVISYFSEDNKVMTIKVTGEFTFTNFNDFKCIYSTQQANEVEKVTFDFYNTEYVDSSALGMMLALQKDLKKSPDQIEIINANDKIKKIFKMTGFEKLFSIK